MTRTSLSATALVFSLNLACDRGEDHPDPSSSTSIFDDGSSTSSGSSSSSSSDESSEASSGDTSSSGEPEVPICPLITCDPDPFSTTEQCGPSGPWNKLRCIDFGGIGYCVEPCEGKVCSPKYDADVCIPDWGYRCSEVSGQGAQQYCVTDEMFGH